MPWMLLFAFALLAGGFVVFWIEPLAVLGLLERLTPNIIYRVKTGRALVALSFDDGPHLVFTPQVLEILERHNAKATFFLIGERALRHPELVARIKAAGHEIANHYFTDGSILHHTAAAFLDHLRQTAQAIGIAPGPKFFRPPGGVAWPHQLRLARDQGYQCVLGSAYPHDPLHPPTRYIQWLIEKNLVPGAIVILHDGISNPARSIRALPHILKAGRQRGLTFVSVGTLMGSANEKMDE
jgi:peptidoglycan/xylan/chitin deacetylase (PgdA/CDA1 family)